MSGILRPDDSLSRPHWERVETLLDRFEEAWRRGERPALDDYRPAGAADEVHVLAELIQTDLEFRLKAGEPARVEDYLPRYPELARDRGLVLALIVAEYGYRRRREPGLSLEEYERRFPAYCDVLSDRLRDTAAAPAPGE